MFGYIVTKPDSQRRRNGRSPDPAQNQGIAIYALDGDKWKPGKAMYQRRAGGNGLGIGFLNAMYTLNTIDRHIAAFCLPCASRPRYLRRICEDGICVREEMQ